MSENNKTLVGTSELAKLFGLSDRRIQQLTADGVLICETATVDGHKVRRYDLLPTVHTYVEHLHDKLKKTSRTDKEIELKEQKLAADIALKESQGELHRLKTAITSGDYISVEEIKLDYARFFVTFKKFATSIPSRLIGTLSGVLEPLEARRIEKEMSAEVSDLLSSFVVAGIVKPMEVKRILKDAEAKKVEKEV